MRSNIRKCVLLLIFFSQSRFFLLVSFSYFYALLGFQSPRLSNFQVLHPQRHYCSQYNHFHLITFCKFSFNDLLPHRLFFVVFFWTVSNADLVFSDLCSVLCTKFIIANQISSLSWTIFRITEVISPVFGCSLREGSKWKGT